MPRNGRTCETDGWQFTVSNSVLRASSHPWILHTDYKSHWLSFQAILLSYSYGVFSSIICPYLVASFPLNGNTSTFLLLVFVVYFIFASFPTCDAVIRFILSFIQSLLSLCCCVLCSILSASSCVIFTSVV